MASTLGGRFRGEIDLGEGFFIPSHYSAVYKDNPHCPTSTPWITTPHRISIHVDMPAPADSEALVAQNETGVTPEQLQHKLESQLEATYVAIEDMSGTKSFFLISKMTFSLTALGQKVDVVKCSLL